jgi:hypothetical protein
MNKRNIMNLILLGQLPAPGATAAPSNTAPHAHHSNACQQQQIVSSSRLSAAATAANGRT